MAIMRLILSPGSNHFPPEQKKSGAESFVDAAPVFYTYAYDLRMSGLTLSIM